MNLVSQQLLGAKKVKVSGNLPIKLCDLGVLSEMHWIVWLSRWAVHCIALYAAQVRSTFIPRCGASRQLTTVLLVYRSSR